MSSTTGIQNLLVNVIRPVYVYDVTATPTRYTTALMMSNVDTYSGNTVSVLRADISDANSNVYVGTGSGNTPATLTRGCQQSVAVGVVAGREMSNVSNSVYLGFNAGASAVNASTVIAIGANANGGGSNNIVLGAASGGTGNSNILIGHGIASSTSSNVLNIGRSLFGNLSTKWIGVGTPTPINDISDTNRFDVSGNAHFNAYLAIQRSPGDRTLDVNGNFRVSDGFGTLDFSNGITTSSNGFASVRGTVRTPAGSNDTIIGSLRTGIVIVSFAHATDINGTPYAARVMLAYTPEDVVDLTTEVFSASQYKITLLDSSIRITDTIGNIPFKFSITYLPLP